MEYIGNVVHMAGTKKERQKARDYIGWLFQQLNGPVELDWKDRKDCTMIEVPNDCVGYVTGARRAALGSVEQE